MASSFTAQLSEIAAKSTNELDLKAQKTAHAQSLIFEKKIAGAQDFETIYQLCLEGFEDLCQIDQRFGDYHRNLFSQQSKTQERDQMTADQNATLDTVLEACLGLLGGRLLLSPAVKVAEWLVRRFRVHEYNTSFLLLTFLPYHATPFFRNLLSILPLQLPPQFKFLGPYITTLTNPPRHAIAYGATNNDGLFTALNGYVLQVCRAGNQHQTLLSFWASITSEAVAGRLDLARSGRKEIERRRHEDVLLKILPVLKDGLSMHEASEMIMACFTFAIILASKSQLADNVLDGLMEAVTGALKPGTMDAGLICLSVLIQQKSDQSVSRRVVKKLTKVNNLERRLSVLDEAYNVEVLVLALIQNHLSNIQAKGQNERFDFVERLLFAELMSPPKVIVTIGLLVTLLRSHGQDDSLPSLKDSVADLLRKLNDSDKFSPLVADAVRESGSDKASVEATLQIMFDEPEIVPAEVDEMELDAEGPHHVQTSLNRALELVPQRTVDEHSFLSHSPSHLLKPLSKAFVLAAQSKEGRRSFMELPLWRSSTDVHEPLLASFFVRVFSGPYSVQVRCAALSAVGEWLSERSDFDSQAMLPYVLPQLADPAQKIREAASEVLLAMEHAFPTALVDGETFGQWNLKRLYGPGDNDLASPTTKDVLKIIQRAVLPVLEECVLDPTQIKTAMNSALKPRSNNNRVNGKTDSIELKKYLRQSFLRLILVHLLSTPLYSIKVGLLDLLANVEKVGTIQKRKELIPLFHRWASLTAEDVDRIASTECLDITHVNSAMCGIFSPTENDAVETLLNITSASGPKRSDLLSAVAERIQDLWPQLNGDRQIAAADSLLNLIFHDQAKQLDCSQIGRRVFESVDLSTDVLIRFLENSHSLIDAISGNSPPSKRRRNNESHAISAEKSPSQAKLADIGKITYILELVDNAASESPPELLSALFHVLDALHQLKLRHQSDLSYLLSLSLGSLLSILRNATLQASKVDSSAIRLDVIIDCMRATSNPQVQNTALLLIASIASISPERVLDNIMPVFTFMETTILRKEDDYTNYIVDQTMDKVIPPLIESLRGRGQDLIAETSDLMFSFAVAYEHIPLPRRHRLFRKLISNLGAETFLWVLISNLIRRYSDQAGVSSFIVSLASTFEVEIQLKTCANLVVLAQDASDGRTDRETLVGEFEKASSNASPEMILSLLRIVNKILSEPNIRSRSARSEHSITNGSNGLMPFWTDLLDRIIRLGQIPDLGGVQSITADKVLSTLLSLVPTLDLFDIAGHFIDAGPETVTRRVLRLLESRLHIQNERSSRVQTKAISFMQTLSGILKTSDDEELKHAAIACVDRICETYGRKDISAAVQAARVISGENCLCCPDRRVNTLSLLCLSSIAGLAKDAVVPIIPHLMPMIFHVLRSSIEEGSEDVELHNASFTLISALLAHVPFILSDEYLDQLLAVAAESRNSELEIGSDADDVRGHSLKLIAKNIELANIIGSLQRTLATIVENDVSAVQQALSLLTDSVKTCSKSEVVKNVEKLSTFLLQAFDLRRIQFTNPTEDSYTDKDVSDIEQTVNSVTIEIIYKLSDTTFRPIFLQLIDWATKCPDVKSSDLSKAQKLRKTTLFNFLAHFFTALKSIVTSYATHIVEPAIAVLNDISATSLSSPSLSTSKSRPKSRHHTPNRAPPDQDTLHLYLSTLSALSATLTHDHDAHFSTPSLFTPLAETLVAQLHLASHPTIGPHVSSSVIPCIIKLATAVVDTPEHLRTLNSLICGLRREEDVVVRRRSVETHLALAGAGVGAEEEGAGIVEEWCSTVLSVGEGMVYVNEMLEDEDEEVEAGVRRLVRRVREVVGEEGIFE